MTTTNETEDGTMDWDEMYEKVRAIARELDETADDELLGMIDKITEDRREVVIGLGQGFEPLNEASAVTTMAAIMMGMLAEARVLVPQEE